MGREDDNPVSRVLTDYIPSKAAAKWVHAGGWFVQKHDLVKATEGNCHAQLSFHAARQLTSFRVHLIDQSDILDRLSDNLLSLRVSLPLVHSFHPGEELDVLKDGQMIPQHVVLWAEPDRPSDFPHLTVDVKPANVRLALALCMHTSQQVD